MSNVKKQNTLFRFVSLRSPELTKNEKQNSRFIFYPQNSESELYNTIKSASHNSANANSVKQKTDSFNAFTTNEDIENLCGKSFLSLAEWISQNRFNLPETIVLEKLNGLNPVKADSELFLWEQLYYQIITSSSIYIKESLIHVLILQNILKYKKECTNISDFSTQLPILAQARIVIPKEFYKKEKNIQSVNISKPNPLLTIEFEKALERADAQAQIKEYNSLLSFVEKQNQKEKEEYQKLYVKAQEEYQKKLKPVLKAYEDQENKMLQQKEETDKADPATYQPMVEKPELPEFIFENRSSDFSSLLQKIPENNYKIQLSKISEECKLTDTDDVITHLKNEIEQAQYYLSSNSKTTETVAIVGNSVTSLAQSQPDYKFIPFKSSAYKSIDSDNYNIKLDIYIPNESYRFSNLTFNAQDNTLTPKPQKYKYSYSNDEKILSILIQGSTAEYQKISGILIFENGSHYEFDFSTTPDSKTSAYLTLNETQIESSYKSFGITRLGIADYKKVVSEVICYDPGEVSHIENIMAREYKERATKKFLQNQKLITESSETETENISDISSTERFEMQSEIAKIIQEQRNSSINTNVHYGYGKNYSIDLGAGFATSNSKEESNRQALTEAKELTQRAMERIVSKIKRETSTKITNEFTEENKHGFDNRKGDHHVSGVYRFINAIYRNQIYNYGKRLMYEFTVPQPSKFHTLWLNNSQTDNVNTLEKPIDPRKCGLSEATVLNKLNYKKWASRYKAKVEAVPDAIITISHSYSKENGDEWAECGNGKVELPKNYQAISFSGQLATTKTGSHGNGNGQSGSFIYIADRMFSAPLENGAPHRRYYLSANNLSVRNSLEYSFNSWRVKVYSLSLSVKCELTLEAYQEWQLDTFNNILEAYQSQLDEYNNRLSEMKTENKIRLETNPLYYRQIEQTVLRKNCITYLTGHDSIGQKMYSDGDNHSLQDFQIMSSQKMEEYGNLAKFLEQAFEWNMMSYTFYPFYWGNKKEWGDLYQFDCNDSLFKNFMQSGMAKVIVTVKPGFEDAVMHYIATGEIWNGGEVPIIGDPLYLSIVDELKEQEYVVEETWETVVPTSLIALQSSGVSVDASGLPCFHKDKGMGTLTSNDKKVGESAKTEDIEK
ncbi:hypothetical protein [Apibacter sp. HY039]|uniref:hypothetical protein n=1 Tax=Apibacter sp. HY039 TaxID=2501476 RepID=UPI000FEBD8B4|nr:hypothetical protein [Apibacter sp. HY039]